MRKLVRPYIECLQICTYSIPSKTQKVIACKLYGICYEITLIGVLKYAYFYMKKSICFCSKPSARHLRPNTRKKRKKKENTPGSLMRGGRRGIEGGGRAFLKQHWILKEEEGEAEYMGGKWANAGFGKTRVRQLAWQNMRRGRGGGESGQSKLGCMKGGLSLPLTLLPLYMLDIYLVG